jgi:hypothetical protein
VVHDKMNYNGCSGVAHSMNLLNHPLRERGDSTTNSILYKKACGASSKGCTKGEARWRWQTGTAWRVRRICQLAEKFSEFSSEGF